MMDNYDEYLKNMNYDKINSYNKKDKIESTKKEDSPKEDNFFYKINQHEFLICDTKFCSNSERTFDIKFFDYVENVSLQKILNICITNNIKESALCMSSFGNENQTKKYEKLLTNPTLRILVENEDLFIDVLSIFKPDDIRVSVKKYNL